MDIKKYIIPALVALVVVGLVLWLSPNPAQIVDTNPVDRNIGALAGPDIPSPYLTWGGTTEYRSSMTMAQATGTICSFQTPAATSTISSGLITFDVGSSTALVVTVAKATTGFATTTTLISDVALAADIKGTIDFTPAIASTLDAGRLIAPSQFVNITFAGASGGAVGTEKWENNVPVGTCNIGFMTINY